MSELIDSTEITLTERGKSVEGWSLGIEAVLRIDGSSRLLWGLVSGRSPNQLSNMNYGVDYANPVDVMIGFSESGFERDFAFDIGAELHASKDELEAAFRRLEAI